MLWCMCSFGGYTPQCLPAVVSNIVCELPGCLLLIEQLGVTLGVLQLCQRAVQLRYVINIWRLLSLPINLA
jgi:hypothetical protein